MKLLTGSLLLVYGMFDLASCAIDADLVTNLPGLETQPTFKHYSGYLQATGTKKLHYWFVESQGTPSADPLVLWMNGGPGCSSMAGLLMEHGPFRSVGNGSKLEMNPYSWNKVANIIYLEAPAGVGFSYSDDKQYATDDDQVAKDNYAALLSFFTGYQEYKSNPFFITGESYGGIYVPTLSVIVSQDASINLKGFAVGNGMSDFESNVDSLMFFGEYHGLWGKMLWSKLVNNCCHAGNTSDCNFSTNTDPECMRAVQEANGVIQSLNVYNLYQDCAPTKLTANLYGQPVVTVPPRDSRPFELPNTRGKYARDPLLYTGHQNAVHMTQAKHNLKVSPPCIDSSATKTYLNRADVKAALHVADGLPEWDICSDEVSAGYQIIYTKMTEQYNKLLSSGKYRALVYNGDVDMACNFLMDEWFVDSLNRKVKLTNREWFFTASDGSTQVAGFYKVYDDIAFVTVKGAGHMVPTDKPIPALVMFRTFITAEWP